MPDVPLAAADEGALHVFDDRGGTEDERAEPRVARARKPPDDAEADHERDGEPDDRVVGKERAVFTEGERDDGGSYETAREQPVEEAGG